MTPHAKIYFKHCNYSEGDFIPCEVCHYQSVDIHHIKGRGKDKNMIENLCALCRDCHNKCHNEIIKRDQMQDIHDVFLYSLGPRKHV